MDRDLDTLPLEPALESRAPTAPDRIPEQGPSQSTASDFENRIYLTRSHSYRLNTFDMGTLGDIGRFRTVAVDDLKRHRYRGSDGDAEQGLEKLTRQGLLQLKTVRNGSRKPPLHVAVLTKTGQRLLEEHARGASDQRVYSGFVKAREVPHDAAIYRMFQAERQRIEREGGTIKRIVLDYELKRNVYTPLATFRSRNPSASAADFSRRQAEVAAEHGLKVIGGRIPLPDLRIEYTDARGDVARVDLELATGHYHGGAMQTKAEAGFTFYVADGSASRLSRVLEEREITAAILSL